MSDQHINDIANIVVIAVTVPAVLNAAIYGLGSRWWESWLGRVLFSKWLSVALVFVFILTRRFWGEYPGYGWWAISLYTFVLVSFVATTVELIIERREPAEVIETPIRKAVIMTDYNKTSAALAVGETVSTESPKVELGKAKAVVAAIAGVAVAVGGVLTGALTDGAIDLNEGIALGIAVLVGLGVPGVGTYLTPTTVTRKA